jgi:hypothetical protein
VSPSIAERYLGYPLIPAVRDAIFPSAVLQSMLSTELRELHREIERQTPGNPAARGYKVYSQADEDGVIDAIYRELGAGSNVFVELGCGNGLENNTHHLLLRGWRGVWVDGSAKNIAAIAAQIPLSSSRLTVDQSFITRDNVRDVVRRALAALEGGPKDVDFLSIDLDGNDAILLDQLLEEHSPRLVCVEYNGKFPYPTDVEVAYDAAHTWSGDDYHGASLAAYIRHVGDRYRLVACNASGVNAFFVRTDLASRFPDAAPEKLFQPPRYHLVQLQSGHPPSLKHLANVLRRPEG